MMGDIIVWLSIVFAVFLVSQGAIQNELQKLGDQFVSKVAS